MSQIKDSCRRFCDSFISCSECPMGKYGEDYGCYIGEIAIHPIDAESAIAEVIQWAKEHPENTNTYANEYFRMHPSAPRKSISGREIPFACRQYIDKNVRCIKNCIACWGQPISDSGKQK